MIDLVVIVMALVADVGWFIVVLLCDRDDALRRENRDLCERLAKAVEAMGEIGEVD